MTLRQYLLAHPRASDQPARSRARVTMATPIGDNVVVVDYDDLRGIESDELRLF